MSATIKRGTRITLPLWSARRRGDRTRRQYATVTRVAQGTVYYTLDGEPAGTPSHRISLARLQQYAEVTQ